MRQVPERLFSGRLVIGSYGKGALTLRFLRRLKFTLVVLFLIMPIAAGCQFKDRKALYQVSVLNGLMKGDYDGKVTLSRIRVHGDFGIGTFDRLDGEEIELDGIFYQIGSDGAVRRMRGSATSPFAMATFFDNDIRFAVSRNPDYRALQSLIDSRLPAGNIPFAVKLKGRFSYIKARSVPAQHKPYSPFAEVVKSQTVFEFRDIEGTLVGFRMPLYAQSVNMPGYHLHFLSRDKTKGGHVLECAVESAEVGIDSIGRYDIALPQSPDFDKLDFSADVGEALAGEKSK